VYEVRYVVRCFRPDLWVAKGREEAKKTEWEVKVGRTGIGLSMSPPPGRVSCLFDIFATRFRIFTIISAIST
jgi:hypothetical protein